MTRSNSATPIAAADRLHRAITRAGSPACVGLDPVYGKLPDALKSSSRSPIESIREFCLGVIDAVASHVGIVKPQAACFERYGPQGVAALHDCISHARHHDLLVILDAKRGDIGTTAEHYAAAAFNSSAPADFLTVNAYLGLDTVEPYLLTPAHGVFVLVRTSNPGSDAVQSLRLADGRTVAEMMAHHVADLGRKHLGACGLTNIGAVVGATKSSDAARLRTLMPDTFFLIPGYGAQGGTLDDLRPMMRSHTQPADAGIVVNASRSVLYPPMANSPSWTAAIEQGASRFADDLRSLFG